MIFRDYIELFRVLQTIYNYTVSIINLIFLNKVSEFILNGYLFYCPTLRPSLHPGARQCLKEHQGVMGTILVLLSSYTQTCLLPGTISTDVR